jgi:hypothetical protein
LEAFLTPEGIDLERLCTMAETRSPTKVPAGDIQLVRYLMKAADGDTAYRDVYLQRAAEKLERSISRADYEQLKTQGGTVEQLLQEMRRAVSRQNWTRVQELSTRVSTLRVPERRKWSSILFLRVLTFCWEEPLKPTPCCATKRSPL